MDKNDSCYRNKKIALTLSMLMTSKHLKSKDLARKLDMSTPAISRMKNGDYNFSINHIYELAKALDTDPNVFLIDDTANSRVIREMTDPRRLEEMENLVLEADSQAPLHFLFVSGRYFIHPENQFSKLLIQAMRLKEEVQVLLLDPFSTPARYRAAKEDSFYNFRGWDDTRHAESSLTKNSLYSLYILQKLSALQAEDKIYKSELNVRLYQTSPYCLLIASNQKLYYEPLHFGCVPGRRHIGLDANPLGIFYESRHRLYSAFLDHYRFVQEQSISLDDFWKENSGLYEDVRADALTRLKENVPDSEVWDQNLLKFLND